MSLYTTKHVVQCQMFPTSLKRETLSWFTRLLSFQFNLSACWWPSLRCSLWQANHIVLHLLHWQTSNKRRVVKTLPREIQKVALNIHNLNLDVALHHMVTILRPGHFANSLFKKPVADLNEFWRRATNFMKLEKL